MADLSHWLKWRKVPLTTLDEAQVNCFHEVNRRRTSNGDLSTGRQLLGFLRSLGAIPAVPIDRTPLGEFTRDYERFLISERGLSEETVIQQMRMVRSFLKGRFGDKTLRFQDLRARDIHRFILAEARPGSAGLEPQSSRDAAPASAFLAPARTHR